MTAPSLSVLVACLFIAGVSPSDLYYWKEYTGAIPPDALPGGSDPDGRHAYIAEAYIHDRGLYTAQIYPGVKEVATVAYGVVKTSVNIKILCTEHPEYFYWIKTTSSTYEQDIVGWVPVKLGYDKVDGGQVNNVGRVFYQGYVIVGDVTPFASAKGNVRLFVTFGNREISLHNYELLVTNSTNVTHM